MTEPMDNPYAAPTNEDSGVPGSDLLRSGIQNVILSVVIFGCAIFAGLATFLGTFLAILALVGLPGSEADIGMAMVFGVLTATAASFGSIFFFRRLFYGGNAKVKGAESLDRS